MRKTALFLFFVILVFVIARIYYTQVFDNCMVDIKMGNLNDGIKCYESIPVIFYPEVKDELLNLYQDVGVSKYKDVIK
ncbi:hypothetical protein [Rodentibacter caecimuris]|uniref:hypothetical protein n=1 Tax=Rodentibacter caecimuris TaxID=1796644 RepID=UPI0013A0A540|nr:hypothetical protein [Rodentibacter heylii]QIA75990.1 hypothetical protein FEE42_00730 [Rodentibacter heylii]